MSYTKTTWVDNTTPIDSTNLNKIEQGIYNNSLVADAVNSTVKPSESALTNATEITEGQMTNVLAISNIKIKGNTVQDGTPTPSAPVDVNVVSGSNVVNTSNKNLFDKNNIISGKYIDNSGNFVNDTNNYITNYFISIDTTKTYWISSTNTSSKRIAYYNASQTFINRELILTASGTLTIPANARYIRISGYLTDLDNTQLELGSTATTYEPHQGKELYLDLPVENLFNYNSWLENKQNWETSRYSINKDYIISTMPTATDWASSTPPMNATPSTADIEKLTWMSFSVKPNTEYTMSLKNNNKCLMQILWFFYNENYGYIQTGNINTTDTEYVIFKFTTTNATKFVSFRFDNESYSSIAKQLIISEIQLEQGSKANAYTPYGTEPIELCKIGDYQDYFYKTGNDWYLHKEIGKTIINGSEAGWGYPSDNRFNLDNLNIKYKKQVGAIFHICNKYKAYNQTLSNGDFNDLVQNVDYGFNLSTYTPSIGTSYTVRFKDTRFTNVTDFKTWLASNNIILYYVLETLTDTEITGTLKEQLEAIYNAPLYEETNITQTNNDLPMVLDITAYKDNINGIKAWIRR